MNLGIKRLAILLGVIGAIIGWFVGFASVGEYLSGYEFLGGCIGMIEGFAIPFGLVYGVYWVVMGFTQSRKNN